MSAACISRSGTTINFDGIQPNMEASMYSTFRANKSGFLILFCITSNHLYVVIGCCHSLIVALYSFYFLRTPSLNIENLHLFDYYFFLSIIFFLYDFYHITLLYTRTHIHYSIIIHIIDTMVMRCRHERI
jgi:hypothetical protein